MAYSMQPGFVRKRYQYAQIFSNSWDKFGTIET